MEPYHSKKQVIISEMEPTAACCKPYSSWFNGIKGKQAIVSMLAIVCFIFLFIIRTSGPPSSSFAAPFLPSDFMKLTSSEGLKEEVFSKQQGVYLNSTTENLPICDYRRGRWVRGSSPLYAGEKCTPWLSGMWNCKSTGAFYKWKPHDCDLPAFNITDFFLSMSNKTIAFIGDSLAREQYQSLMCITTSNMTKSNLNQVVDAAKDFGFSKPTGSTRPSGWASKFTATNTTLLFYWSTTLCDLVPNNTLDAIAMHLDRPPAFLRNYIHKMDVVIVNTGHHWNRGKMRENKWILHANGMPQKDRSLVHARNLTLYSMARWLEDRAMERPELKIFMRTLSPRHFTGGEWNTGGRCDNLKHIDTSEELENYVGDQIMENAVSQMTSKVQLLDITYLSQYRGEAHIAQFNQKGSVQDCLHWCLPGVPDTWNELLYAYLINTKPTH